MGGTPSTGGMPATSGTPATGGSPVAFSRERLAAEKQARIAAARAELDALRSGAIPATRLEVSQFVADNIAELRGKLKTSPIERRELNTRLFARPDLPEPAERIQPVQEKSARVSTKWAGILFGRAGWHGVAAGRSRRLFYLMLDHGSAFYVDLEEWRDGRLTYRVPLDFDLRAKTKPLAALEAEADFANAAADVEVYFFEVEGQPAPGGGIFLRATRGCQLTAPLPKAARTRRSDQPQAASDQPPAAETDSAEDVGEAGVSSDVQETSVLAGTGREQSQDSGLSSMGGSSSDDLLKKPFKPATGGDAATDGGDKPATGGDMAGARRARTVRTPLWDNGFFYIADNEGKPNCKMLIHDGWCGPRPVGLGTTGMSRTLTPCHYGETRAEPTRTWFLLRAWMVWRARQDGWHAQNADRARFFAHEAGVYAEA